MSKQFRRGKPKYRVYSEPTPLGASTVLQRVSYKDGMAMVALGFVREVVTDTGIYFQWGKPKQAADKPGGSKASCTALSRAEVELIAGSGFKGGENLAGVVGKLPKQDLVAEARAKLDAFFPVTRTRDGVAA